MRVTRPVRWAFATASTLLGIVVLVTLVGLLLPEHHLARVSTTMSQPPDSVWAVIRSIGDYPSWWPDVKSAERLPDRAGHEIWVQRDRRGGRLPLEIVEDGPPSRLVMRIADEDLPFGGTWTYEIARAPGGCRVTVTENGFITNPIFRFMSRFLFGHYATLESYLTALGRRFEEEVTLTRLAAE